MTETRLIPFYCQCLRVELQESVTVIDGIDNYDLFEWIYNQVKEKVPFLQYYKGPDSHKLKRYQMGRAKSQVKLVLIYFKTFTF